MNKVRNFRVINKFLSGGVINKNQVIVLLFANLTFAMLTQWPFYHSTLTIVFEYIFFASFPIILYYFRVADDACLFMQLTVELAITSLIWFCGIVNKYTSKENTALIVVGVFSIIACWLQVILNIKGKNIVKVKGLLNKIVRSNIKIHIIVIIFFIFSVSMLDYVPYNDSACYYSWNIKYLSDMFNFSSINIQWLRLANHLSFGYGLFTLIGELLLPHFTVGVHVVNLFLAVVSIYCYYGILNEICSSKNKAIEILGTAIFAFTPYLLGLIGEINVDIASIYLFVIFLFCYVKKYYYLTILFGWFFIFTKEPSVIYYCFFCAGIVILNIYRKKYNQCVWKLLALITPVVYWGLTFISVKMTGWYWIENLWEREGAFNTFGFTETNTILKLKEIFFLNFNWFYLVLILLIVFSKRTYVKIAEQAEYYIPLFTCFLGFIIFSIFYITFQHPRYVALGTILLNCIILPLFINSSWSVYKTALMNVMAVLLFVQSFITIDPITIMLFERVNREETGSNIVNMSYQFCFDDSSIYNREYSYYREMIDFILKEFEYNPTMALVFPPAYSTGEQRDIMYWNDKEKRVVAGVSEDSFLIKFVKADEILSTDYEKLLFIYPMERIPDYNIITADGNREIVREMTYNYRGFKARCYEVDLQQP